ncbi:hypothetical protein D3C86_1442270 [compost metagenome]
MIVIHALDAKSHAQIRRAFLVVDLFGPVFLFPLVARDVEQAGVLAVRHGIPVLASEERWRDFYRFTLGFSRQRFGWPLALVLDRASGLEVDVAGPCDVIDERKGVLQFAVVAIDHIEEAVTVGMAGGLDRFAVFVLVIEQHQFVVAGEIPGVVRRVLVEPFHFAGARVDTDLT